jgi:GNAT superfamily N-acetyltransferase
VGAELNIVRLAETHLETAADVLARAFSHDPFAIYVFPEAEEREDLLFWYFGTIVQYGLLFGEVHGTANCEGVAVWLPHDGDQNDVDRLQQAGLLDAPDVLGPEPFDRLVRVTGHLERLRKNALPGRHWYLPAVGVDPLHQGRGVGGALLRWGLTRADAEGVPCYLETFNERNAPFYSRHSFACSAESVIPGSDLRFWTFRRDPTGVPRSR